MHKAANGRSNIYIRVHDSTSGMFDARVRLIRTIRVRGARCEGVFRRAAAHEREQARRAGSPPAVRSPGDAGELEGGFEGEGGRGECEELLGGGEGVGA